MGLPPVACWDSVFGSLWGQVYLSLVSVVCCQVEVSVSGRSLVQRSPTECGLSECDREASMIRRSWPTRSCCALEKCRKEKSIINYVQEFQALSHYLRGASMSFVISAFLFVCLPVYIRSAQTGRVFVKFDVGDFYENLYRDSKLVRNDKKYHPLYIMT